MNREKLRKEFVKARERLNELRKQLDAFDYDKKLNKIKRYVGKCYKEVGKEKYARKNINCVFIYEVEEKNCGLEAIQVDYWEDSNTFFDIRNHHFYNTPDDENKDTDFSNNWEEISKEEFMKHYEKVMKRINLVVK